MYFDFDILRIILRFFHMSARKPRYLRYFYHGRINLLPTNEKTLWNLLLSNPGAVEKILKLIDQFSPETILKKNHRQFNSFMTELLLSRLFDNGFGGRGQGLRINRCMESVFNQINLGDLSGMKRHFFIPLHFVGIMSNFLLTPLETLFFTGPPFKSSPKESMDSISEEFWEFLRHYTLQEQKDRKRRICIIHPSDLIRSSSQMPPKEFIAETMRCAFPGASFKEMMKKIVDAHELESEQRRVRMERMISEAVMNSMVKEILEGILVPLFGKPAAEPAEEENLYD